ncbi:hypothetical protein [Sporosarcina sp. FSL K6-1508]|uniref:hypothetical protein n=1 Tax=Sporosarcina sp. FSL K6-1508 TaxID=2921553 RepID=UPI0030F50C8D
MDRSLKQGGKVRHLDTRSEGEKMVDSYIEALPSALKLFVPQAKGLKAKYDSLIAEGFTPVQALEIVKTRYSNNIGKGD